MLVMGRMGGSWLVITGVITGAGAMTGGTLMVGVGVMRYSLGGTIRAKSAGGGMCREGSAARAEADGAIVVSG